MVATLLTEIGRQRTLNFVICPNCREGRHDRCPGGNRCDCQHRPAEPTPPVTGPAGE